MIIIPIHDNDNVHFSLKRMFDMQIELRGVIIEGFPPPSTPSKLFEFMRDVSPESLKKKLIFTACHITDVCHDPSYPHLSYVKPYVSS